MTLIDGRLPELTFNPLPDGVGMSLSCASEQPKDAAVTVQQRTVRVKGFLKNLYMNRTYGGLDWSRDNADPSFNLIEPSLPNPMALNRKSLEVEFGKYRDYAAMLLTRRNAFESAVKSKLSFSESVVEHKFPDPRTTALADLYNAVSHAPRGTALAAGQWLVAQHFACEISLRMFYAKLNVLSEVVEIVHGGMCVELAQELLTDTTLKTVLPYCISKGS